MSSHIMGYIYLIHFAKPYKHAKHYLGWTQDISTRLAAHGAGNGSRLMAVISEAGIQWELSRVWEGDRFEERRLKRLGGRSRICPICLGTGHPLDLAQFIPVTADLIEVMEVAAS